MKSVYIAGKITGDDNYRAKFQRVQDRLEAEGHIVMNPAVLPDGFEHGQYMVVCYAMIQVCDCVLFLQDWRDSVGAGMEHDYALRQGKGIWYDV